MKAMMTLLVAALVVCLATVLPAAAADNKKLLPVALKAKPAADAAQAEADEAEQSALDMQREMYGIRRVRQVAGKAGRDGASDASLAGAHHPAGGIRQQVTFANLVGSKILVVQTPGPGSQLELQQKQ